MKFYKSRNANLCVIFICRVVKLSDKMLEALGRMTQLEYLNLFETNLTARQVEELAARIPTAKVENKTPGGLAAVCGGYLHLELSK